MSRQIVGCVCILVIFATFLSTGVVHRASAFKTWIVDDDGPADFHTIQEGIDAASDNDTIFVKAGYYPEHVEIGKSVALVGEGWWRTTINCTGNRAISVGRASVNISGFTICSSDMDGIFLPTDYERKYFFSVTENNFKGCWRDIWANESFAFHICRNNFMDSYPTYCEGPDAGRRSWNKSHEGNYWATYNGSDSNHDGIGDLPFNRVPGGFMINADYYPLMVPWTPPDIAVRDVTTFKTVVGQGYTCSVNVTLDNQGNKIEAFNISVYANSTVTYSESIMLAMTNQTLSFKWNTTGLAYGNYTINAYAEPLLEEIDISDNNYTCSFTVHVGVPGDITGPTVGVYDGTANMRDIQYLILLFNTNPSSPNWKPNADINNDATVNMRDIQIAILNFNKHE